MRWNSANIQVIYSCEQGRLTVLCLLATLTAHTILNLEIVPIFIANGAFFTLDLRQSLIEISDVASMLFRYSRLLKTVSSCSLSRVRVSNRGWWPLNTSRGASNSSRRALNSRLRIGRRWSRLLIMPPMILCTSLLGDNSTANLAGLCRFHLMTIVSNVDIKLPKCPTWSFCRWRSFFIHYTCLTTRALVLPLLIRDQISIDTEE